jgi:hypothetical protein
MEATETKTVGKYKIEIFPDEDARSPRVDMDNLGTMVCFNSRYRLGDKHNYSIDDYESWDELESDIIKTEKVAVILPLMIYDHSGITMYVGTSGDRWDSSFVGFIFISKEKARKEYGWKNITKARKQKLEEYLRGEVKTYDQYLTGDVYGFRITDTDTEEEVDSCWGYYGEDYCMEDATGIVEYMVEKDKQGQLELEMK